MELNSPEQNLPYTLVNATGSLGTQGISSNEGSYGLQSLSYISMFCVFGMLTHLRMTVKVEMRPE